MEVVSVEDAATAFLLAEQAGHSGERYIVSERMMSSKDILTVAAEATGHAPPRIAIPLSVMKLAGRLGDAMAAVFHRDIPLTTVSVRLMHDMPPLDHSKATRELGWNPTPTDDAIRAHARFFRDAGAAGNAS
jgi:dihydroflavonol-4-reductase